MSDIFFSVTDGHGVLVHANDLFVAQSRYDRDSLIGSSYTITNHPDMPSVVFDVMWAELAAGRMFAGTLTNLAADGTSYTVYTTVSPIGDDTFLWVSTRPMDAARSAQASGWHRELAGLEAGLRASGTPGREAGERVTTRFAALLEDAGFPTFAAFHAHTFPQEVARLERRAGPFPAHPAASGEAAALLARATEVDRTLGPWPVQLHRHSRLSGALRRAIDQLQHELDATASSITDMTGLAASAQDSHLYEPLTIWAQMQDLITGYVMELIAALGRLDDANTENCVQIALAKLHSRTLAAFAVELVDRPKHAHTKSAAVTLLATSFRLSLAELDKQSISHRLLAEQTITEITKSTSMLSGSRKLLLDWQRQIASARLSPEMRLLAEGVNTSVTRLGETFAELGHIVELCDEISVGEDSRALLALIEPTRPGA